jgi:hypothetical protein
VGEQTTKSFSYLFPNVQFDGEGPFGSSHVEGYISSISENSPLSKGGHQRIVG